VSRATLALAALAGLAPFFCLRGFYDAANLPQGAWIVAAGWLWVAGCLFGSRLRLARPPAALLLALAWSGASLAWAEWRADGWPMLLLWLACAAVGLGARALWRAPADAFPVLAAVTASAGLVGAIGLAQHLLGFALFPQGIAPASTFVNKNVGAGFVLLTWPLGACLLSIGRRPAWRVALGLALALQLVYLFVVFSRSVWLALAAQLAAALLLAARRWPLRRRLELAAGAAALAGALALAGPGLPGPIGEALRHLGTIRRGLGSEVSADQGVVSVRGRLAVWANTLAMVRERPVLGVGLGGHRRLYAAYAHAARPDPLFSSRHQLDFVHNDFLQVTAEQGLVGLLLWLTALATAFRALWARASRGAPEEQRVAVAAGLLLVGLCVDGCFAFPLERALPPLLVALALAAALAPAGGGERRAPRALAWGALATGLCLGAVFGRWLLADRQVATLLAAQRSGDIPAARRAAERALALEPAAFPPAFLLGRLSLDEHRPAEALVWLGRALRARPFDPATLGTRAEAWGAAGDLEQAVADARRVARILPREAGAWYELGRWLERAGRPAEAREAYVAAARLAPGRADVQARLAVAAWRSGARDEAVQAAEAALRLDPGAALVHKLLGLALLEVPERRGEGLEHLRTALALDPRTPDAERLRALLQEADARQ